MRFLLATIALILLSTPAYADRPVTPTERTAIEKALTEIGCTGGKYEAEKDDGILEGYEVDNARCADGALYDIDLDVNFNITDKDKED